MKYLILGLVSLIAACRCEEGTQRTYIGLRSSPDNYYEFAVPPGEINDVWCMTSGVEGAPGALQLGWVRYRYDAVEYLDYNVILKPDGNGGMISTAQKPLDILLWGQTEVAGPGTVGWWSAFLQCPPDNYYDVDWLLFELGENGGVLDSIQDAPRYGRYHRKSEVSSGFCVRNRTANTPVTIGFQFFSAVYECRAEPVEGPPWMNTGAVELRCPKPIDPDPVPNPNPTPNPNPEPPPEVRTCSGELAKVNAAEFSVLAVDANGCGDAVNAFANTLEEAEQCVRAAGLSPVERICQFEVLLETSPPYSTYVIAANRPGAVECARYERCGIGCEEAMVTQEGNCIGEP